jgi:hypothetical protein
MEEIMIEFEQCTSLIFKPLLHHLKSIVTSQADFLSVWTALLETMERLLSEAVHGNDDPDKLIQTLKELASEHLRNSIMVLHSNGVLTGHPLVDDEVSTITWDAVGKMAFCSSMIEDWKLQASAPPETPSSPSSD